MTSLRSARVSAALKRSSNARSFSVSADRPIAARRASRRSRRASIRSTTFCWRGGTAAGGVGAAGAVVGVGPTDTAAIACFSRWAERTEGAFAASGMTLAICARTGRREPASPSQPPAAAAAVALKTVAIMVAVIIRCPRSQPPRRSRGARSQACGSGSARVCAAATISSISPARGAGTEKRFSAASKSRSGPFIVLPFQKRRARAPSPQKSAEASGARAPAGIRTP